MNIGIEFSFVGIKCTTGTSYGLYAVQDASFIAQPSIKRVLVFVVGMNGMEQLLYRIHTTTSETRMPGLRPGTLTPRWLFLIERDANIRDIVIVIRSLHWNFNDSKNRLCFWPEVILFQLLDCVAIPVALALSCLILGVRYRMVHIVGVSVSLMGVGCLVWAGIDDNKDPSAGNCSIISTIKRWDLHRN